MKPQSGQVLVEALGAGVLIFGFFTVGITTCFRIVESLRREEKEIHQSLCQMARPEFRSTGDCTEAAEQP